MVCSNVVIPAKVGQPAVGGLQAINGWREHDPEVVRVLEALCHKKARIIFRDLEQAKTPRGRYLSRQTEHGLLPHQLLTELGVALEVLELGDVDAHHHVHGPAWHDRLESRDLVDLVAGKGGVLFQVLEDILVVLFGSVLKDGGQAGLDQGVGPEDRWVSFIRPSFTPLAKTPFLSWTRIHPILHPGTMNLLARPPVVRMGTVVESFDQRRRACQQKKKKKKRTRNWLTLARGINVSPLKTMSA